MSNSPQLTGRVERLLVNCPPDDKISTDRDEITCILTGIEGDKHATAIRDSSGVREREIFGRHKTAVRAQVMNWREWSAVSIEEMMLLAKRYGLPATEEVALDLGSAVGANMVVSGIPKFTRLLPTSLLVFPDCSWITMALNFPCRGAGDQVAKLFPSIDPALFAKHAWNIRGLVGKVFEGGKIKKGDPIEVRRRGIELPLADSDE